eukprot:4671481-Amphidinium_carterae.1
MTEANRWVTKDYSFKSMPNEAKPTDRRLTKDHSFKLPLSSVVIQHGAKTGAPRIEVACWQQMTGTPRLLPTVFNAVEAKTS